MGCFAGDEENMSEYKYFFFWNLTQQITYIMYWTLKMIMYPGLQIKVLSYEALLCTQGWNIQIEMDWRSPV
jgi:hypothetical protein